MAFFWIEWMQMYLNHWITCCLETSEPAGPYFSVFHFSLPGSLDMAPKPPDGTFIIDSDLSPSLPTSDSVLVCAHSAPEGKSFGVWVLASLSPLAVCVTVSLSPWTRTHTYTHKESLRKWGRVGILWSVNLSFFFTLRSVLFPLLYKHTHRHLS